MQEVRIDVDPPQRAAAQFHEHPRSCCSEMARLDGLTREHDIDEAIKVIHPSPDMLTVPYLVNPATQHGSAVMAVTDPRTAPRLQAGCGDGGSCARKLLHGANPSPGQRSLERV